MSEWIDYGKSWSKFCTENLNRSGTQIEVQDFNDLTKQDVYLIGDINKLGGVCDCCSGVLPGETVIRYRGLTGPERPIKGNGETCCCGKAKYNRLARCNDSTDYLNLHYDICPACGFEVYAHCGPEVKRERYLEWRASNAD